MARNNKIKANTDSIHVVSLSSYNRPKVVEDKKKDWVA